MSPSGLNPHRATKISAMARNKHAFFTHTAICAPRARTQHAAPAPGTGTESNTALPCMTKLAASSSSCRSFSKPPRTPLAPGAPARVLRHLQFLQLSLIHI
eukprot:11488318-Alexandrium_andersonii.AAC.1